MNRTAEQPIFLLHLCYYTDSSLTAFRFKWKQKAVGVNSAKCYVTFTCCEMFLMLFSLKDINCPQLDLDFMKSGLQLMSKT